jgi:hypothetical protein
MVMGRLIRVWFSPPGFDFRSISPPKAIQDTARRKPFGRKRYLSARRYSVCWFPRALPFLSLPSIAEVQFGIHHLFFLKRLALQLDFAFAQGDVTFPIL